LIFTVIDLILFESILIAATGAETCIAITQTILLRLEPLFLSRQIILLSLRAALDTPISIQVIYNARQARGAGRIGHVIRIQRPLFGVTLAHVQHR